LKIAEHQRHPNLGLQLAMEEVAIAGVQQPFVASSFVSAWSNQPY